MEYRPSNSPELVLAAIAAAVTITAGMAFLPQAIMAAVHAVADPWWSSLSASAQLHWTRVFKAWSFAAPALPGLLIVFVNLGRKRRGAEAAEDSQT